MAARELPGAGTGPEDTLRRLSRKDAESSTRPDRNGNTARAFCRTGGAHRAAGVTGAGFCTATVPICRELGGDVLVVDLRPGRQHGRVAVHSPQQGFIPTGWADVSAMLADVADRVRGLLGR